MLLIIMVMALGFTVAGFLTTLHRTVFPAVDNVGDGAILLQFDTVGHSIWSSVICTLGGPYILFVKAGRPTELWHVSVEGGEPQKLLEMDGMKNIRIHPDGRRIAFACMQGDREIWAMENFLPASSADK